MHVHEKEAAEGEVDLLGQDQVLAGLGQGDDLGMGGGGMGHLVAGPRVAVDGVDTPVLPDHFGQGHRHVAPTGADVDATPAFGQAEAAERGGQRAPVHVVAQALASRS